MEMNVARKNAEDVMNLADIYEKDYWIVFNTSPNEIAQYAQSSEVYDSFMRQAYTQKATANELEEEVGFFTNNLSSLRMAYNPSNTEDLRFVESTIPEIFASLQNWVAATNQTVSDYLQNYLYKDATKVVTPAKYHGVFSEYTRKMELIVIVGTLAGLFAGFFAALWRDAFPKEKQRPR